MGSVYKRGKTWWISYKEPTGRRIRKPASTSKKEAANALARIEGRMASGEYEDQESNRLASAPPFGLGVTEYLRSKTAEGKKASSYHSFDLWVMAFGKRHPASISTDVIVRQLDAWQSEREWSNASRNRAAAQLAGFFSFAFTRDWVKRHPMERGRVPQLKEPKGRTRWLRDHEIEGLRQQAHTLEGIDDDWRQVLDDVIVFASSTGLRFSRLCDLRRADYADGFIVIDVDKNGERLHVPIPNGELKTLVDRRADAAGFPASHLFPGPNGGNAKSTLRRVLPKVVTAAGLRWGKYVTGKDGKPIRDEHGNKVLDPKGCTFHTFRHSFASNAFLAGVPDSLIQKLGNWKKREMLDRYRHHGDEQLREAAGKVVAMVAPCHTGDTIDNSGERATNAPTENAGV